MPVWGFARSENNFLEFYVDEIEGLQLVLDSYQALYSRYASRIHCTPHTVYNMFPVETKPPSNNIQ